MPSFHNRLPKPQNCDRTYRVLKSTHTRYEMQTKFRFYYSAKTPFRENSSSYWISKGLDQYKPLLVTIHELYRFKSTNCSLIVITVVFIEFKPGGLCSGKFECFWTNSSALVTAAVSHSSPLSCSKSLCPWPNTYWLPRTLFSSKTVKICITIM